MEDRGGIAIHGAIAFVQRASGDAPVSSDQSALGPGTDCRANVAPTSKKGRVMRGSAAGWYADVADATIERWWDGTGWTERTRTIERSIGDAAESNSGFFVVPSVSSDHELDLLGAIDSDDGDRAAGLPDPDEVDLEEILVGTPHPWPRRLPREVEDEAPGTVVRSARQGARRWVSVAALVTLVLVIGVATFAFVARIPTPTRPWRSPSRAP